MSEATPDASTHLEPPSKTTEKEDPGAEDTASNSDDEHFSDASEGHLNAQSNLQTGGTSPVPRTRVERVDSSPQHGEVPGTAAYEMRGQDAVPDEIEVLPESAEDAQTKDTSSAGSQDRPLTPGDSSIPRTVVEKVNPESPSHGEVPGTGAYEKRQADAVPDLVRTAGDLDDAQPPSFVDDGSPETNIPDQEIPETKVSQIETMPTEEELPPHPKAHQSSPSDAMPDTLETVPDVSTPEESLSQDTAEEDDDDQEAGDEFDEFVEEQDDMGDDDFGDFDDGFQEPGDDLAEEASMGDSMTPQQPLAPPSVPPLTNFDDFKSTSELLTALQDTLDILLPASQDLDSLPPVEPIPDSSAIFSTERSLSLWSQLVAPPPLQPQNWVKSRIRRLFLVSLGVPVDLDEILPASKQKKLILPSIDIDGTTTPNRNRAPKEGEGESENTQNTTTAGLAPTRTKTTRRGAPPPPELDLSAVRRLCATTDAALSGLTDTELKEHVQEVEQVTLRASELLEYWLKRRDGLVSEKEAFEGVIENLVSHVRRVRK
ncbi:uncharacterized protein N7498_003911 [Penicillium cinerascens]|uniref:Uncharacterized protein n=1 Tax=Penicillium cinerascens TaxID=70096 RepID=A0A9W9N353_9EURO|nr:uncharacterized protein N7498_003911 [Penicillium cinerascens]KAJ5212265.1 hypothetical protein N7498_003911 [Penicillium cinerascens]